MGSCLACSQEKQSHGPPIQIDPNPNANETEEFVSMAHVSSGEARFAGLIFIDASPSYPIKCPNGIVECKDGVWIQFTFSPEPFLLRLGPLPIQGGQASVLTKLVADGSREFTGTCETMVTSVDSTFIIEDFHLTLSPAPKPSQLSVSEPAASSPPQPVISATHISNISTNDLNQAAKITFQASVSWRM
eukprot:TRINITY_DN14270_c0_g1_i2.p1 TRINITY_DN14270_c0_g1~~TRINITY_DN14270_c0_g1_i2.p1  ORF type:complete len:189 (+),score=3.44 TRINITY_DN14270_c0_g1_i2:92-658(+)